MRQLTTDRGISTIHVVSKLPMRQLTVNRRLIKV